MNKENIEPQENSLGTDTSKKEKSDNNKTSFECYLKQKNPLRSPEGLKFKRRNKKHEKKIKFIDEVEKAKPFEEVVDVESYKMYNIDISEEQTSQPCNCILF